MQNIVLCGFMGCGKSTVGKVLAQKTGRRFVDMDAYIEKKAGMTVSEIFAREGEEGFRDREHAACRELSERHKLIIASGGGALTFARNTEVFRGRDTVVLLDVPPDILTQRLCRDETRPLLQRPDREQVIQELYAKRLPLYRAAADVTVTGKGTPMQTAAAILEAIRGHKSAE